MQTRQRARAAAAARLSSLAEQVLHVCAPELRRHLRGTSLGALRLVCKSARAALDACLHELILSFQDDPEDPFQRVHEAQGTDPGLQSLLANCGRRWPAVRTLVLQGCGPVSLAGCTLPPHLETLSLKDSRPVSAFQGQSHNAPDPLSSLPATLQCFKFTNVAVNCSQHCQSLCQALIPALPRLQSLTCLVLSDLKYDEHLCGLHGALRPLRTSGARHGGGEVAGLFAALSELQALTRLELQGLDDIRTHRGRWAAAGDADLHTNTEARLVSLLSQPLAASLHHLTRLEVLSLEAPIFRGGAERLAPALQRLVRLRQLDLGGCELGMPAERVHLSPDAGQAEITEAVMAHSGLGALGGALAALTALTRLGLAYNGPAYFITALPQSMPQLLSLSLSIKPSGDCPVNRSVVMVAATLRRYTSLTALNLMDNPRMSHSDSTALVEALTGLTNLRKLYMGGGRGGSLKVAAFLTPVLQHLWQLEDLSVSCALWRAKEERLSYRGRPAPADTTLPFWSALAELTALTKLDLNRIRNTGDFVEHMARVLPQLTNLQHLDISYNDLGDRCAIALAPALSHLVRLTELQAGNLWGAKGMRALRRSVAPLTRLQVLQLEVDDEAVALPEKYLYEDMEGWPYIYDSFSSVETDSHADWSSEDVEGGLSVSTGEAMGGSGAIAESASQPGANAVPAEGAEGAEGAAPGALVA